MSTTTASQIVTTTSNEVTTTSTSSPPVKRIPENLQQLLYELTIKPNFTNEKFSGDLFYTFTCLEPTNQVILHMQDLLIENSSLKIINSSSSSMPIFLSWSYDQFNQLMIFTFSSNFTSGTNYTLRVIYSGDIIHDHHSLYMSHYTDVKGRRRIFMTSHMEATSARGVLPCIDEPARKAIFKISVIHDPSYAVWSNGEIQRTEPLNDGRTLSHFTPTLKMSTYLLALIVAPKSDFACLPDRIINSKNIKSRVCGRIDILPQLTYADEVAYRILEFFNTYFDIDYPLSKIEHFAVPDFSGEAMENYGLLIYDELGLIFDEKTVSSSRQQYITELIAHEVAHQWVGDLVTPAWWSELWLKEGIASYMETLASNFVQPSWMLKEQFFIEKIFQFIKPDSLSTSRPISIEATNLTDISQLYDSITYYKGATLTRMMSMFLGDKTLQKGIQMYLKGLSYSSATQEDLWKYLDQAANHTIDIEQIMTGWTRQSGYPLLEVNRNYSRTEQPMVGGHMVISQQPFNLLSTTTKSEKWWIPFKYFDRTFNQSPNASEIIWLNDTSKTLTITTSDSDWILANLDYLGIYRTKYDAQNFCLIMAQLEMNHTCIPTITRGALIDDVFALSRASLINASDPYTLIRYLKNETDFVPWTIALSAMNQQEVLLAEQDIILDQQNYFLELILPIYNKIGWTPVNQLTDWLQTLLQPNILSTVCRYRYQECIEAAQSIYRNWKSNPTLNQIPANVRSSVYCTIIREGSRSDFTFLWTRLQNESIANEVMNLLEGLACTEDPPLIVYFLEQHFKNDSIIRDQYVIHSITNIARSPRANQVVWNWIRDNWSKLLSKRGVSLGRLSRIIEAVSSQFITVRKRDELKAFANSITNEGTIYRQYFQLLIDRINADIEWITANLASINTFFRPNNNSFVMTL
ncbi:unnamed protein product [Rotaria sp. Silwood2]|nr:unnamed protein product [Rotaria sp. Silwood2]CAF2902856.1 unnamed protein product [Rotaria sp. Silwood2]